ncbi:MAG: hypothetical protein P8Z76_07335 [Alphaproteobacteria bacterium]
MIARIATAFAGTEPRPTQPGDFVLSAHQLLALHAIAIAAILAPMVMATYPPLVDYPNHLARIHVLATLGDNPMLQEKFVENWALLPNLGMDALLVPLARILPIYPLGKLFVVGSMLLFIGGTYTLRWVLWRRIGLWPAAVLLAVYNHAFAWGFLNYIFGLGGALFAVAGWIWLRDRWRWQVRAPLFALVALALFFCHMFALGVYALAIGSYELGLSLDNRDRPFRQHLADWAIGGAQFVLPLALWFATAVGSSAGVIVYNGIATKFTSLVSMVLFHVQGIGVATLIFLMVLAVGGCITHSFRIDPRMKVPLIVLSVTALAMPSWLFSSWGADLRMSPVIAAFAAAGLQFDRRNRLFTDIVVIIAASFLAMRIYSMTGVVRKHDAQITELRAAISENVPRGARLLPARIHSRDKDHPREFYQIHYHSAAFAVIDRSVYLPTMFTDPEKQPLVTTSRYHYFDTPYGHPVVDHDLRRGADRLWAERMFARRDPRGRKYYWAHWPSFYDYVVVFWAERHGNPAPRHLDLVKNGSFFDIYKVARRLR